MVDKSELSTNITMNVMHESNKKINLITLISATLLKITLDVNYTEITVPTYGYTGFYSNTSFTWKAISWIIFFLMCPFLLKTVKSNRPSSFVMTFIFLLSVVPFIVLIGQGFYNVNFLICNGILYIALFSAYIFFQKRISFRFSIAKHDKKILSLLIPIITVSTVIMLSFYYTGFRFNLSLDSVYEYRTEISRFKIPTLLQYLFSTSRVVNMVMLLYTFTKKRYALSFIFLMTQLLSFSFDGLKSVLFMTILVLMISIFYSEKYKYYVTGAVSGVSVLSLFFYKFAHIDFIHVHFIRRMMFVPNMLGKYYFDFFSTNTPDYYKQSFLRHLGFKSSYEEIDNMIGRIYFNKPEMGANNGLISDSMANLGYVGLIVLPILIVIFLCFYDYCAKYTGGKVKLALGIYITFILISSFLLSTLLTHGLFISSIVLYFCFDKELASEKKGVSYNKHDLRRKM